MKDRFKYVEINVVERNKDEVLENQFFMYLSDVVDKEIWRRITNEKIQME